MTKLVIKNAKDYNIFDHWPDHWPAKEHYASQHHVRPHQRAELARLLEAGVGEREVERFLAGNPEVLALMPFIYSTGHHAAWIYPKAQVRPANRGIPGLIPDYVLAGASSNGIEWFALELKGPNEKAFTKRKSRVYLSPVANQGICQLLSYMDVMARSQAYLRDELRLAGFREPRGVLMIGTEEESQDDAVREFKGAWNRAHPKLQIRSFNALLRIVDGKLQGRTAAPEHA